MENWYLTNFLADLPVALSFNTALENNTIFYNNFSISGGFPPPPAGAPPRLVEWGLKFQNESLRFYENL